MGRDPDAGGVRIVILAPDAFRLDPRLAGDATRVSSLPACELLVMDDARFPWAICVPRVGADLVELHDLDEATFAAVMVDVRAVARRIAASAGVEKVNVGALGNIVRQLHVHVVGRRAGDAAWPGPVWGHGVREPHGDGRPPPLVDRLADL